MASSSLTSTTWSPNSYFLRYSLQGSNRSPNGFVFLQRQVSKMNSHVRVLSVHNWNGKRSGKTNGRWWRMGSQSSVLDDFKGWSASEERAEPVVSVDPQRKPFSGGVVGAGIAGVILTVGVTFAAFSLNKHASRLKPEMELSTTQQEEKLVPYSFDRAENENEFYKDKLPSNDNLEGDSVTNKDSLPPPEVNEDTVKNNFSDGFEALKTVSAREASQDELVCDEISIDNYTITGSHSGADDHLIGYTISLSSRSLVMSELEANVELEDGQTAKPKNTPDSNENPAYFVTDETEKLLCSRSRDQLLSERVSVNAAVGSGMDAPLEPGTLINDGAQNDSFSSSRDVELNHVQQVFAEPFVEGDISASSQMGGKILSFDTHTPLSSFSSAGIPAPSKVSVDLQLLPGDVLVPAVVDPAQGQALAALQVLKVIEHDVQPGDLCTRREYARWLVSASSALSRNTGAKVYPAMYIENVTELAYDDITPEDPDFSSIQGLAEAGLIASKLSARDMYPLDQGESSFSFFPESPLSRQDLVSWRMALEKRRLPTVDRKLLHQVSGFIDIDRINADAWPALVADLSSGEQGIVTQSFGFTRLFQPGKPVTKAQAAIALATGESSDIVTEELARIEAESMAESAVSAHGALVAQVEEDINANFGKEIIRERERISILEKTTEEAKHELDFFRSRREEENIALLKERAAVESEMEVFSRLRCEVEEQLQSLMGDKVEMTYEKERIIKLRKEAENENQEIVRLQYELEVERKALTLARAWAEDEAKRAREQAKALEEARDRWEKHGIKVVVDDDLREDASSSGIIWLNVGKQFSVEGTVSRAESLAGELKVMATHVTGHSQDVIKSIISKIVDLISFLRALASNAIVQAVELKDSAVLKAGQSTMEWRRSAADVGFSIQEGGKRVVGDCKVGVEKLTQRFKTRSL